MDAELVEGLLELLLKLGEPVEHIAVPTVEALEIDGGGVGRWHAAAHLYGGQRWYESTNGRPVASSGPVVPPGESRGRLPVHSVMRTARQSGPNGAK